MDTTYRIAKFIAASGYCSRRDAEKLISANRVMLNNSIISDFAIKVTEKDDVRIDNKAISLNEKVRLWIYHKPAGMITTHKDPQGRPTVFANLPSNIPRVVSVGRLDYNSEGLLLLTNSGSLAHTLESPKRGIIREYKCRISGSLRKQDIAELAKGITIDGFRYGSIKVSFIKEQGSNSWVIMTLTEGKNREIRRAMAYFGREVSRLIRVRYGKFMLNDLDKGEMIEVEASDFIEYLY